MNIRLGAIHILCHTLHGFTFKASPDPERRIRIRTFSVPVPLVRNS